MRPSIAFFSELAYVALMGSEGVSLQASQHVGGAEIQQVRLGKALAERGYSVALVTGAFGQPAEVRLSGMRVIAAYDPFAGVPGFRFLHPRLTGLWRGLNRANADIVFQEVAGAATGLCAAWCAAHGKRFIFACASDMDTQNPAIRLRSPRDRLLYKYGLTRANYVFAQSDFQLGRLKKNYGLDSYVVRNPIPLGKRRTDPGDEGYVLWVNTIKKGKRPDRILRAAQEFRDVRFVVCGGPPPVGGEEYHREFVKQAEEFDNVELRGYVTPAELECIYQQACFVLHTSESEGFPNVFLEAWTKGIPTISFVDPDGFASRAGGEVATTDEEMIAATRLLATDRDLRVARGEMAHRVVRDHFSEIAVIKQFETALGILDGRLDAHLAANGHAKLPSRLEGAGP